jgi:hypothetical protein
MKTKKVFAAFALLFLISASTSYAQDKASGSIRFSGGLMTGYYRGYSIQTNFTAYDFLKEFPFELRFGIGLTFLNPGYAADARRIFINDATNGVPEKKGRSFDYRLDFLMHKSIFGISHSYLVFGPRYSSFKGNFKYVGGNEDFDVTSRQWGVGANLENHFKMMQKLDLVLGYGLDFYFPSRLTGHDTSYSPDNDNVNPRNDNQTDVPFVYKDANKAIKQPMFMPRVMIGVNYYL